MAHASVDGHPAPDQQRAGGDHVDFPNADVWVGLDIVKAEHFADVLDDDGERRFATSVISDEASLRALLSRAAVHGTVAVAIDQPGSIAQLVLAVCVSQAIPVAYVPGLVVRRAADLCPGESQDRPPLRLRDR